MKVLKGICSFVPLVVWKRLQSRSTRTMMTTQRRTVLPVEFKDVPPRMAWNAAAVPLDTELTEGGYENSRARLGAAPAGTGTGANQKPETRKRSPRDALFWFWFLVSGLPPG